MLTSYAAHVIFGANIFVRRPHPTGTQEI